MVDVIEELRTANTAATLEAAIANLPAEMTDEQKDDVKLILQKAVENDALLNAKLRRRVTRLLSSIHGSPDNNVVNGNNSGQDPLIENIISKIKNCKTSEEFETVITEIPNTIDSDSSKRNLFLVLDEIMLSTSSSSLVSNAKCRRRVKRIMQSLEVGQKINEEVFTNSAPIPFHDAVEALLRSPNIYGIQNALNSLLLPSELGSGDCILQHSDKEPYKTALKLKEFVTKQLANYSSTMGKQLKRRLLRLQFFLSTAKERETDSKKTVVVGGGEVSRNKSSTIQQGMKLLQDKRVISSNGNAVNGTTSATEGNLGSNKIGYTITSSNDHNSKDVALPVYSNSGNLTAKATSGGNLKPALTIMKKQEAEVVMQSTAIPEAKPFLVAIELLLPLIFVEGAVDMAESDNAIDNAISLVNTNSHGNIEEGKKLIELLENIQKNEETLLKTSKVRRKVKRLLETLGTMVADMTPKAKSSKSALPAGSATGVVSDAVDVRRLDGSVFKDIVQNVLEAELRGDMNDIFDRILQQIVPGEIFGGNKERRVLKRALHRMQTNDQLTTSQRETLCEYMRWVDSESSRLVNTEILPQIKEKKRKLSTEEVPPLKDTQGNKNNREDVVLKVEKKPKLTPTHTFFVGQLSFQCKAVDIENHIRSHGVSCGHVKVRLLTNVETGKSRGIAFVDIDGDDNDVRIIIGLHHSSLCGRRINIEKTTTSHNSHSSVHAVENADGEKIPLAISIKRQRLQDKIKASEEIDELLATYEKKGVISIKSISDVIMNRFYAITKAEVVAVMNSFEKASERNVIVLEKILRAIDNGGRDVDQSKGRGYGRMAGFGSDKRRKLGNR